MALVERNLVYDAFLSESSFLRDKSALKVLARETAWMGLQYAAS
jgi:hypothetical protein